MLLTEEELQRRRTPSKLIIYVAEMQACVLRDPEELAHGICKKGLYKQFLDELLPLSQFAQLEYPSNFLIEPRLGNQGFDAVVYDEQHQIHEYLELTVPHDGFAAANRAKVRAKKGHVFLSAGNPCDDFLEITPFVMQTCSQKSQKDYSNAKLIVVVNVLPSWEGFEAKYEQCVSDLCAEVKKFKFRARGVFLFFPPNRALRVSAD
jgi:hypothetical protein